MFRFLFFLLLFPLFHSAQPETVDSLKKILAKANHDTTRCRILSLLVDVEYDDKLWPLYNEQLSAICLHHVQNIKLPKNALDSVYISYWCNALNNRGFQYQSEGNVIDAIKEFDKCVENGKKIGDKANLAMTYNNLGGIYVDQQMHKEAIRYFEQSLELRRELKDSIGIGQSLMNLSSLYSEIGEQSKSLEYLHRGLKVCLALKDMSRVALLYNNLATASMKEERYDKALGLFNRVIQINDSLGNKRGLCGAYGNMADLYLRKGEVKKAREYGLKAFGISSGLGYPVHLQSHALILYNIERKIGNWKDALKYHEIYSRMKDSLSNIESKKAAITQELKIEYEKKKAIEELGHQKELAISNERGQKQKVLTFSVALVLILVLVFSVFVVNRLRLTNRQKKIIAEQKHLVEEKQKEIVDSINYAKRIQQASMSSEKYIDRILSGLKKRES